MLPFIHQHMKNLFIYHQSPPVITNRCIYFTHLTVNTKLICVVVNLHSSIYFVPVVDLEPLYPGFDGFTGTTFGTIVGADDDVDEEEDCTDDNDDDDNNDD